VHIDFKKATSIYIQIEMELKPTRMNNELRCILFQSRQVSVLWLHTANVELD